MPHTSEYIKITITVIALLVSGFGAYWLNQEQDQNRFRNEIANCQARLRENVAHHEERIVGIEQWLESNRKLPETMARIEENTAHMNLRIGEILVELKEFRGKR